MSNERDTTTVEEFTNDDSDTIVPEDVDVTEEHVQTEVGYELTVTSKRGTGTYNNDKVKQEVNSKEPIGEIEREAVIKQVKRTMATLRAHQPDEKIEAEFRETLEDLEAGEVSVEDALDELR